MKRDRFLLTLNDDSFDLILYSLIEMKNRLQSEGRYTDAADEALVRFLKAKRKFIRQLHTWPCRTKHGIFFQAKDLVSKLTCEDDGSMEAFLSAFVDEIWQDLFFSEEEEYDEDNDDYTDDDSCGKIRISVEGESCDDLKDVFDDILKAFGFHIPDEDWGCEHCE